VADCDCHLNSFTETYSDNFKKKDIFFIKGVVSDIQEYNCNFKVIEDLKENIAHKPNIFVWHYGTIITRYYSEKDTLVVLLHKCISDNDEKTHDYTTFLCETSVLNLSNGYVSGYILPKGGYKQTMEWNEFQKLLKSTKKIKS